MNSWNGARTGWVSYNAKNQIVRADWDTYQARLARYAVFEAYYDNTVYESIETFAAMLKAEERLYRWIRGLDNVVPTLVNLFVSNVYKGAVDINNLNSGALPFIFDNPAFEPALTTLLRTSNMSQQLSRYVRYAALYGDAFLWVVDDPQKRRVRIEVVHPSKIRDYEADAVGNVNAAVFEYERPEDPQLEQYQPSRFLGGVSQQQIKTYVYTMKVTKVDTQLVRFETFKDGKPFAFNQDAQGNWVPEWLAPYPCVPLKPAFFEPREDGWGANCFYSSRRLIDEINDQASIIDDTIRRVIEPLLKARGVTAADTVTTTRDERTGITVLYISNAEGDIEALPIPVDLAAAGANKEGLQDQLENRHPILALRRIREGTNLTAPGVRVGYSDAISQIENTQKNLDPPVVGIVQIGVSIAAIQGYEGYEGFTADSFDNGDMELSIAPRDPISDTLSKQERINAYGTVAGLPPGLQRKALEDMDVSKKEIDAIIAEAKAQQQNAVNQINQQDANSVEAMLAKLQGDDQQQPALQPNVVPTP